MGGLDMQNHVSWPAQYDPRCSHIYSLNEADVNAPRELVWKLLIDAEHWSSYYPHAEDVKIVTGESVLALGTKYTWKTAGLPLVNTVKEFVPGQRLAWDTVTADTEGATCYHGWVITPTDSGCHVLTEETQQGEYFLELARRSPGVLYRFHQDWVDTLARAAEVETTKTTA
jgi:uncharacterized protein YndB with AHSA1/START domain